MRKLFTLFAAVLITCVAFAEDQYPEPETSNSLSAAVSAVGAGETVWLDDATPYVNHYASQGGDDYTKVAKSCTIRAKEGKKPVVKLEVPIQIRDGASVKFIGIKFDGTSQTHYDAYVFFKDNKNCSVEFEDCEFTAASKWLISVPSGCNATSIVIKNCNFHDNTSRGIINQGTIDKLLINDTKFSKFTGSYPVIDIYGKSVIGKIQIEGCEFDGIAKQSIKNASKAHVDSCIIDDCIFHNGAKEAAILFPQTDTTYHACNVLKISNSTFANFTGGLDASLISFKNKNGATNSPVEDDAELKIDHCTFYNLVLVDNTYTYGFVDSRKSGNVLISNCIFANPTAGQSYATYCYGGYVDNSLIYNTNGHKSSGQARNGVTADPKFVDAANGDFTLGAGSPALTAATDGGPLGDPRWGTKFFIAGIGGWNPDQVAVAGSSYTFKDLAAGNYQFKITRNGTWNGEYNVYGYDALTAKIGGLYRWNGGDSDNNIMFTLEDAGDVTVTYIHGEKFTVEGDFKIWPVELAGSWDAEWKDKKTFVPAADKLTASVTVNLTGDYYEFKLIDNGTWKGKWINNDDDKYYLTRSVLSVNNLEEGKNNIVITPDVAGGYKFTWTYGTGELTVEFPALPNPVYYLAGSMFTDGDWDKALQPMTETDGIWSKTVNFESTDSKAFKIVRSVEGIHLISQDWLGLAAAQTITATTSNLVLSADGAEAVGITPSKAGAYVFTFNPDGNKVGVTYPTATSIDNANANAKAVKSIVKGQLLITRDGKTYNVLGTQVK